MREFVLTALALLLEEAPGFGSHATTTTDSPLLFKCISPMQTPTFPFLTFQTLTPGPNVSHFPSWSFSSMAAAWRLFEPSTTVGGKIPAWTHHLVTRTLTHGVIARQSGHPCQPPGPVRRFERPLSTIRTETWDLSYDEPDQAHGRQVYRPFS